MKYTFIILVCSLFVLISCESSEPPGGIRRIGIEVNHVSFTNAKDSVLVKTKEPGWDIGGVYILNENNELERHWNDSYMKAYAAGNKIAQLCDTMTYEWIELIKANPHELKVSVQENPSTQARTIKVLLDGTVGYFGEDLTITQKGGE